MWGATLAEQPHNDTCLYAYIYNEHVMGNSFNEFKVLAEAPYNELQAF